MQAGEELALAQALADERAGDTEEVLAIAEQAEAEAASEATKLRAELSAMSMRAKQVRALQMGLIDWITTSHETSNYHSVNKEAN